MKMTQDQFKKLASIMRTEDNLGRRKEPVIVIDGKQYTISEINFKEVSLVPFTALMKGDLDNLYVDDGDFITYHHSTEIYDEALKILLDKENRVEVIVVEIDANCSLHKIHAILIKKGMKLPSDATGRVFQYNKDLDVYEII